MSRTIAAPTVQARPTGLRQVVLVIARTAQEVMDVDLQLLELPVQQLVAQLDHQLVGRQVEQLEQECVLQTLHFHIVHSITALHFLNLMGVFQMEQTVT